MRTTVLFAAAGVGLMIALASHDAQAFVPMSAMPAAPSDVTTVAGGCGFGWHRGPRATAVSPAPAAGGRFPSATTVRPGAVPGGASVASAAINARRGPDGPA